MSEELPPLWALDRAALAGGDFADWADAETRFGYNKTNRRSIIAHAQTIAQYEQPPEPRDLVMARKIIKNLPIRLVISTGEYDEWLERTRALLREYAGEDA